MKLSLTQALPYAEGFSRLLYPFAEVAVHDLETDCVAALFNPFSKREPGDSSYLDRLDFNLEETVIGPYPKLNWDGRRLKCVSIVIRGEGGQPEGLMCINMDVSAFESFQDVLAGFLGCQQPISAERTQLFQDDLYERVNQFIQAFCRERQVAIEALSKTARYDLVRALEEAGAFTGKNAASYIARVLGVSRATIYNDLKNKEEGDI